MKNDSNNINTLLINGKTFELNKPFLTPDAPKKYAVYIKSKNGKVKRVTFGLQDSFKKYRRK